jgi:O-antigen/teichoic acid export membrane protein
MLFLTGGVVSVTCAINEPFVKIWVGPQFFGGMLLTALFLVDMVLRHFDLILSQALFAFGYERLLAIKCLADSILSAAVVFVCVHSFGLAGAMLGFVIGVLFVRIPVDILLFKREFNITVSQILGPYWAYLWRMALIGTAGIFAAHHFLPKTYFGTFLLGAVAGIAYLALTVPHMLRTPLGSYCRALWSDVLVVLKTKMSWRQALK